MEMSLALEVMLCLDVLAKEGGEAKVCSSGLRWQHREVRRRPWVQVAVEKGPPGNL